MDEEGLNRAREIASAMHAGAAEVGLYARDSSIVELESGRTAVLMNFRLGQRAFRAPEEEKDDELKILGAELVTEAGIEAFRELQRRARGEEDG